MITKDYLKKVDQVLYTHFTQIELDCTIFLQ